MLLILPACWKTFQRCFNNLNWELFKCWTSTTLQEQLLVIKFPHDGSINHSDKVLNDNAHSYSYKSEISTAPEIVFATFFPLFTLPFLHHFTVLRCSPQNSLEVPFYFTQTIYEERWGTTLQSILTSDSFTQLPLHSTGFCIICVFYFAKSMTTAQSAHPCESLSSWFNQDL